jgi:hypothetical protein
MTGYDLRSTTPRMRLSDWDLIVYLLWPRWWRA